ncbi:MAG TPA: oligogalacturonate lyase, partial [Verrucomicrobiae bacterium]|nr:oligogalacturonate lyase [Verrucomicrobiae bacterium]
MKSGKKHSHSLFHVALTLTALFLSFPLAGLRAFGADMPGAGAPTLKARSNATQAEPPTSWIDPDTGHRVIRLTREPGSDSFYFNVNGYTPDGKEMAYTTPNGISLLNLDTLQAKRLVTGPAKPIIVAHKSANLYYTRATDKPFFRTLWCVNLDTGVNRKIADLPRRANVTAINADETLGAGA